MKCKYWTFGIVLLPLLLVSLASRGAATDLAAAPLVSSSTSSVLPNIMFVLDDSGSMDWDYMPDWANDNVNGSSISNYPYLKYNSDYNGVAYNPAVTYIPPVFYNSDGTVNTSSYPNQTAANTSNWASVKNDGYGVQSSYSSNLAGNAFYYLIVPGEYCTNDSLRTCNTQATASATYPVAARMRWCNSNALSTCQAAWVSGSYRYPRIAAPTSTTISISGSSSTAVSSITVNGVELLSYTTSSSTNSSTVASRIAGSISGGTTGYAATVSGSTVTIYAPTNVTYTPVITKSGSMTLSTSAFSKDSIYSTSAPGTNVFVELNSGRNSYPYPGTSAKASSRTDCAGATCTYDEEMTNYANWWAYYRTRMQMMKTSATIAFSSIGSNYRVGYLSINTNENDFLGVAQFTPTNKRAWYAKMLGADPSSSTPLRSALSAVGRYYAGLSPTYSGTSMSGDPMQYSCQQNFTILSSDGYWNSDGGLQLNGSTAMDNQDGNEPRPYLDGASTTYQKSTSRIEQTQARLSRSTSQLQKRVTQIQERTTQIQQRTAGVTQQTTGQLYRWRSQDGGTTWNNWNDNSTCDEDYSGSTQYQCVVGQLETRTSNNGGSSWTSWSSTGNCTLDTSSSSRRDCRVVQNWATVASCSPTRTGSAGSYRYYGNSSAVDCQDSTGPWTNAASCTPSASIDCQTTDTDWVTASSCTASGPTGGQTVTCQTADTGWLGAPSCSASSSGGETVTCQTQTTGPDPVSSCSSATANAGNSYTQTSCSTDTVTAATGVASCTAVSASAANSWVATTCNTVSTGPTTVTSCNAETASAANNWTTTTCSGGTTSGGTSNTLADVAMYYYKTDLRTSALGNCTVGGVDVCTDNVPASGQDAASHQHMTTFTLGLGASGNMQYSPSYMAQTSGDYFDVKVGTAAAPSSGICSWGSSGQPCNWPTPSSDSQANIDDMWHAAVNGRGTYYSATNPTTLATGLQSALAGVSARLGASAAATTSNPNTTYGDNFVFETTFTTVNWDGEVVRKQLDLVSGQVSSTSDWAAQDQLDSNTSRTLYTFDATAGNKLKSFTWGGLTAAEQAYFTKPHTAGLSQFCATGVTCLSASDQTAAEGQPLVNFLRGERTHEGAASDTSKYFRMRTHVLGDIANAEALYVKQSKFAYVDADYSDFISANTTRQGMVYAASNDGMLHALNADTGAEVWAYVPKLLLPNLYLLADKNYSALHRYYADGTPTEGEVYFGGAWHTIVVAGLNGGGRGYYALDVTDPSAPKALWEFSDNNLGYTYGNPEIGKLADGTWVVIFSSGYNNITPGDGVGRLYIVNASTGALIRTISTGVGDATTPSGLSRIRAWADNAYYDNTIMRVYGGDNLGNLWRFDVNNSIAPSGYDAALLATLQDSSGVGQPITARPEIGDCYGNAVVFVGTGRYLGSSDIANTDAQTFYGVKDALATSGIGNPRTASGTSAFVEQTITSVTCPTGTPATICAAGQNVRTIASAQDVDLTLKGGWYIDLPESKERSNTDPTLQLGTLGFTTNVPGASACTVGGTSYRFFLDACTGKPVATANKVISTSLGNALATRPVYVRLPNNVIIELTRLSDGTTVSSQVPIAPPSGNTRRVSWRELIMQ